MKWRKSTIKSKIESNLNIFIIFIALLWICTVFFSVFYISDIINPNSINSAQNQEDLKTYRISISKQLSVLNRELYTLTEDLNYSMNYLAEDISIKDSSLFLNEFIYNEFENCLFSMQKAQSSGVFLFLDTDTRKLIDKKEEIIGFYVHNTTNSYLSNTKDDLTLLYGSSVLSKNYGISLDTQWNMFYQCNENQDLFYKPAIENAIQGTSTSTVALSHYSIIEKPSGSQVLIITAPLLDKDDNIYGICGLEISEAAINENLEIDDENQYYYIFTDTDDNKSYTLQNSIFLGKKDSTFLQTNIITLKNKGKYIDSMKCGTYNLYAINEPIQIYPINNISQNKNWEITTYTYKENSYLPIVLLTFLFVIISILLFVLLRSKIKNIKELKTIKNNNTVNDYTLEEYNYFKKQLESLTKTEKEILQMHIDGLSTEEIMDKRKITANTLKSHNNKVYAKMEVKNKSQLVAYYFKFN